MFLESFRQETYVLLSAGELAIDSFSQANFVTSCFRSSSPRMNRNARSLRCAMKDARRQNIPELEVLSYRAEARFQIRQHRCRELINQKRSAGSQNFPRLLQNIPAKPVWNQTVGNPRNDVIRVLQMQIPQDSPDL